MRGVAPAIWRRFCQLWRLVVLHGDAAARNVIVADTATPPAAALAGPEVDEVAGPSVGCEVVIPLLRSSRALVPTTCMASDRV